MDDKLKIFWNLDVLVKMCRAKNDGPSLRIEEEELLEQIKGYNQEIDEINSISEDENYDTSAEMADRNIEIITKKQLQNLKSNLKDKNKELTELKNKEKELYDSTSLLRENKASNEKYISSMQERLVESTDGEILDRYNALIAETAQKVEDLNSELKSSNDEYDNIQNEILKVTDEITALEEEMAKKKSLLAETQANLENKENYIDTTKKEKNEKRLNELKSKIEKIENRIEEIRKEPKYIETKIKDIINSKEDNSNAREYIINLVNIAIKQPYINVPTDNALEEELLRATQARDSFANEIDQKSYNILEADTPEKIRTDFLNKRIDEWNKELIDLHAKIAKIDEDSQFNYEEKERTVNKMIQNMNRDLEEYVKAYEDTPENDTALRTSLEVALEERKKDIVEAEKIANLFKEDEAEDITKATRMLKFQCEEINDKINMAEEEIKDIKNRLMSKKMGLIDITARNKDKENLKVLAQTVIDIKHRRQFPETPIDIVDRLEEELGISIKDSIDMQYIQDTSQLLEKNYDEYVDTDKEYNLVESVEDDKPVKIAKSTRSPIDVNEVLISRPEEMMEIEDTEPATEMVTEPVVIETEPRTEIVTEPEIEIETEPVTEIVTEPEIEVETEPETEMVTEPITEMPTVPEVETEPVTEAETIPETEPVTEANIEATVEENTEPTIELSSSEDFIPNIESQPIDNSINDSDLSLENMFSNNNTNVTSEELSNDLDKYISNLDN